MTAKEKVKKRLKENKPCYLVTLDSKTIGRTRRLMTVVTIPIEIWLYKTLEFEENEITVINTVELKENSLSISKLAEKYGDNYGMAQHNYFNN